MLPFMGGWPYLDGLIARACALYQINRYARDLATISLRRRLVEAADRIEAISTDDSYDLDALRSNAAMAFFGVVENVPATRVAVYINGVERHHGRAARSSPHGFRARCNDRLSGA